MNISAGNPYLRAYADTADSKLGFLVRNFQLATSEGAYSERPYTTIYRPTSSWCWIRLPLLSFCQRRRAVWNYQWIRDSCPWPHRPQPTSTRVRGYGIIVYHMDGFHCSFVEFSVYNTAKTARNQYQTGQSAIYNPNLLINTDSRSSVSLHRLVILYAMCVEVDIWPHTDQCWH